MTEVKEMLDDAWRHLAAHEPGLAARCGQQLLAIDPACAEAWALLAVIEPARGRATELLRVAHELDPEGAKLASMSAEIPEERVHEALGTAALRSGEFALAGRHFGWALSADPQSWSARRGLLEAARAKFWPYRPFARFRSWATDYLEAHGPTGLVVSFYAVHALLTLGEHGQAGWFAITFFAQLVVPTSLCNLVLLPNRDARALLPWRDWLVTIVVTILLGAAATMWLLAWRQGAFPRGALVCFAAATWVAMISFALDYSVVDRAARRRLIVMGIIIAALVVAIVLQA